MARTKKTGAPCAATKGEIDPSKNFWLSDGRVLKSLSELADALETSDISVWNYHVTADKNDFANWVENVFGDKPLGKAIRAAKSPKIAVKKIRAKQATSSFWSFL